MIYTYYSYKGGAGRSMAVANIAEWLCLQGLRVAMIDWDLEAPGLENFFLNTPEQQSRLRSQLGVIDLLLDYKRQYPRLQLGPDLQSTDDKVAVLRDALPPLSAVLVPIHKPKSESERGGLWLMPAGWRDGERFATYALAVQSFNWAEFYRQFDGHAYFEWFRRQLVEGDQIDVVLIDSRTGVTEMGGVCTRHLADVVISFCVPNIQNLTGVQMMAASFRTPEVIAARDNRSLEIIIVPTRIENSEIDLRNDFEKRFKELFENDEVTPPAFRRSGRTFWDLRIPYIPNYAYIERLAVGREGAASELVDAYERLARGMIALAPSDSRMVAKLGLDALQGFSATVRAVPFMVRNLPPSYVERPRLIESIVGALLTARDAHSVSGCVGLTGLPGSGKTTLAIAVCKDRRVGRAFVDGILWASVGPRTDAVLRAIERIVHVVTGKEEGFTDAAAATLRLGEILANGEYLIVVDDVWNASDLQPFMVTGPRCVRLVTTPDSAFLPSGARPIHVDVMEVEEAVNLLAAGVSIESAPSEALTGLADLCAEFPLALSLANRALSDRLVKDQQPLAATLEFLFRLGASRGVLGLDSTARADIGESLQGALESVRKLVTDEQWTRFCELVAFSPDFAVPTATVARLWRATGNLDDLTSELLCNRLGQVSLVQLDSRSTGDYLQLPKIISGYLDNAAGIDVKSLQNRFLATYTLTTWADLPRSETYLWYALPWHLNKAGSESELGNLLLDFKWIKGKLAIAGIAGLTEDYLYASSTPSLQRVHDVLSENEDVLREQPDRLASVLVRALAGTDDDALRRLVEQARAAVEAEQPPSVAPPPVSAARDGIFISYRRRDARTEAALLYDTLNKQFGRDRVFMDLASIELGSDFEQAITQVVERCGAMLVVIGKSFLDVDGRSKTSTTISSDFVFREIEVALARDMRVIPVLVQGAVMPSVEDAPASIAGLFRRNAFVIDNKTLDYDVARLIEVLRPLVAPGALTSSSSSVTAGTEAAATGLAENTTVIDERLKETVLRSESPWWKVQISLSGVTLVVVVLVIALGSVSLVSQLYTRLASGP